MASRTARSVDRTVDKMFKQMAHSSKAGAASAGSASSAAQALARMAEIQKRIARGDMDAAQFVADQAIKKAESEEAPETRRERLRALQAEKGKAEWWKSPAALIGATVVGLVVAGFGFSASSGGGHSVEGKVLLNEQAANGVEIVFHSISRADVRVVTRTESDGRFAVKSLPAGDYKVVLKKTGASATIPQPYLSPLSTPLRLKLHEDMADLTFNVTMSKPASRKS